jgi:hypothetical protein
MYSLVHIKGPSEVQTYQSPGQRNTPIELQILSRCGFGYILP